jgi:Xaa-Pro aminopeptidase
MLATEAGLEGLLVTPGADLAYLTGYGPMPLERLTLLVVTPGREPVMLVPMLERPAALASAAGDLVEVLGWTDGEDPYEVAARLLPSGRLALSDQTWASHVLGLERAAGGLSLTTAGLALPLLRAVKDAEELAALRAVGAAVDGAFDDIVTVRFEGSPRISRTRSSRTGTRRWSSRSSAPGRTPPHRTTRCPSA